MYLFLSACIFAHKIVLHSQRERKKRERERERERRGKVGEKNIEIRFDAKDAKVGVFKERERERENTKRKEQLRLKRRKNVSNHKVYL